MEAGVHVRNLGALQKAFAAAPKETKAAVRVGLAVAVEPVRRSAELDAVETITRIGPKWSRMRTGVTRKAIYIAPKTRASRRAGFRSRPNLAPKLLRAMELAVDDHADDIERHVETALDRFADNFNQGH